MEKIDLKIAKQMVANYATTRKKIIDEAYKINDTKSAWIPIDALKDFVNQLPADATGARIYLASYDGTETTYPNQTTVVLAGTVKDAVGNNTDAIIGDEDLAKNPGLVTWNRGTICPPDCY